MTVMHSPLEVGTTDDLYHRSLFHDGQAFISAPLAGFFWRSTSFRASSLGYSRSAV